MMEMIISFCPRAILSTPGIRPQRPPAAVPASRQRRMPGKPVSPELQPITHATTEPMMNWPSPPRLNTPQLVGEAGAERREDERSGLGERRAEVGLVPNAPFHRA
jgi:hypothetical protein